MTHAEAQPIPKLASASPVMIVLAREAAEVDVADLSTIGSLARVVLLAVQPEPEMVRSRGILKENVIRQLSSDAEARLQPLLGQLASAGVEARTEVQLSEEPQAILDVARRHGCNSIVVLGRPIVGARRRWLSATGCVGHHLGARLAALSDTPVTVLPIDAGI